MTFESSYFTDSPASIIQNSKTKLAAIHFLMKIILSRSKMEVLEKRRDLNSLLTNPLLTKKEKNLTIISRGRWKSCNNA